MTVNFLLLVVLLTTYYYLLLMMNHIGRNQRGMFRACVNQAMSRCMTATGGALGLFLDFMDNNAYTSLVNIM